MSLTFNWKRKLSKDIHGIELRETQWRASLSIIDESTVSLIYDIVMTFMKVLSG